MDVAQFYGMRALVMDEIRHPEEIKDQIEKIKLDEVKSILNELVKEELIRSVVVGPKGK
jgi:predicted Zn-dependent peptidase